MAMGSGTDVAVESADVTLMNSSLESVVTAIDLSDRTMRNIHQNPASRLVTTDWASRSPPVCSTRYGMCCSVR